MLAFKKALEAGADGIELDINMTKDEELAVIHDETVDRTTFCKGLVSEYTMAELKKCHKNKSFFQKNKAEIPSLEEVLDWARPTAILLNIELKTNKVAYPDIEAKTIELIHQYGLQNRSIISSFNPQTLVNCHEIDPEIELALLSSKPVSWEYAQALGITALHLEQSLVTEDFVEQSQAAGIAIRPYTVNKPAAMKTFAEYGCAGIITDEITLARECIPHTN